MDGRCVMPLNRPIIANANYDLPPSELARATISAAMEAALVKSALNWWRLSSPRTAISRSLLFPNLVNLLSSLEGFASAFHDTDDCHLQRRSIDTANRWLDRILCVKTSDDLLGIAQHRDIRVMRTEKALPRPSFRPSSLCQFRQNLPFHASKPTPSPRLGHSGRCRDPPFVSLLS